MFQKSAVGEINGGGGGWDLPGTPSPMRIREIRGASTKQSTRNLG